VSFPAGPWDILLLTHPDAVRHVLQDNYLNYSKDTFQYRLLGSITGSGLLTSDGDLWRKRRRMAQPAFHRSHIGGFAPAMAKAVSAMMDDWERYVGTGRPVDIAAEMMHLALDIVGRCVLGVDLRTEAASLADATLIVLDHIMHRARLLDLIPSFLPTSRNRRFQSAMDEMERCVMSLIDDRLSGLGPGDPGRKAVAETIAGRSRGETSGVVTEAETPTLLTMLCLKVVAGDLSRTDVRDEIMTMIIAGHETVASALAWTWYLLADHPEVDEALARESRSVLGEALPSQDAVQKLPFTTQVFHETMRLYPTAWMISRRAIDDDVAAGAKIPAGALVMTSPYATQRHPDLWPEPDTFDPGRFSEDKARGRPRYAYFPFGGGPHICIGNNFAVLEAVITIAVVTRSLRVCLVPDHPVVEEPGVTLRPKYGLVMTLERRP
jgi:cytochrome P450